ncbi:alpha/beta fold hydrolase [Arcanobacterium bovis]|uniref:Alpha/beta hydrolase n=1 Tax=Arcanobacterium bovis TaxID=2529275 RepID=A0A4Q9V441_9ACTO|nr:alpha/beta hydrolase [Arcanobacterium bovis]TBW23892.1 alpha/beta hydrolase [Arcanobacterium bovis]
MTSPADNSCVTLPGPWEHRLIQANGAQFHVVHAGEHSAEKPLVILVHGFPQYWWAWRNQVAEIASAGYEVIAIDRRGFGGSDKTPHSEDSLLLSQDLIAIVRSMGASKAVLVGHGRGGGLAWSAVAMAPQLFSGLVTVSSPHPRTLHRFGAHITFKAWRHAITSFITPISQRGLTSTSSMKNLLKEWSAPNNRGAAGQADLYAQAMRLPGAASVALAQLRWTMLAQQSLTGRRYLRESANPVCIPVLAVRGDLDPLLPKRAWYKDREFALGRYERATIPDAGHFVPEEQPEAFTQLLLEFLDSL